jgi:DNA-binding transcriptional regulator LsrR (DeoR family)
MGRKRTDNLDTITAAYLVSSGGMRQSEVASVLGVSQAVVSRLLKLAHGKYLRKEVRFISESVSEQEMRGVLQRAGRRDLSAHLEALVRTEQPGRRGPVLRVFQSDSGGGLSGFMRQVASYLRQLLARSEICGITWGGMLWHVLKALRDSPSPAPWAPHRIRFVPLCGEPLGNQPASFSSSNLVHEFDLAANGDKLQEESLYLGMVPAFIPDGFEKNEVAAIWKLIGLVRSYSEIFGPSGLADRLDTIVTSTGPAERALGFGQGTLLQTGKGVDELPALIDGDVGGVCFPRATLTRPQKRKLDGMVNRWTGLKEEHLRLCSNRAAAGNPIDGRPGVVVISTGRARAHIISRAVRMGLVNHLIIDQELEEELNRVLSAGLPGNLPMSPSKSR